MRIQDLYVLVNNIKFSARFCVMFSLSLIRFEKFDLSSYVRVNL